MSYAYDSLEQALEYAIVRVPVQEMGALIAQVEYVISNNADGRELEENLLIRAGIHSPKERAFKLDRLHKKAITDRLAA